MKVYVGWTNPLNAREEYFLKLHPLEFKKVMDELTEDIWTNNCYAVNSVPPEQVFVCSKSGAIACLTDHPKYNTWKDEMESGELWSLFGEEWVKDIANEKKLAKVFVLYSNSGLYKVFQRGELKYQSTDWDKVKEFAASLGWTKNEL